MVEGGHHQLGDQTRGLFIRAVHAEQAQGDNGVVARLCTVLTEQGLGRLRHRVKTVWAEEVSLLHRNRLPAILRGTPCVDKQLVPDPIARVKQIPQSKHIDQQNLLNRRLVVICAMGGQMVNNRRLDDLHQSIDLLPIADISRMDMQSVTYSFEPPERSRWLDEGVHLFPGLSKPAAQVSADEARRARDEKHPPFSVQREQPLKRVLKGDRVSLEYAGKGTPSLPNQPKWSRTEVDQASVAKDDPNGRSHKRLLIEIVNAIFDVVRNGCGLCLADVGA